eukprot:1178773-Prorocentrum_minimum.AAC.2
MRGELALAEEGYRQAIALSRTRVHTAALNNLGVLLKKDQSAGVLSAVPRLRALSRNASGFEEAEELFRTVLAVTSEPGCLGPKWDPWNTSPNPADTAVATSSIRAFAPRAFSYVRTRRDERKRRVDSDLSVRGLHR